MACKKAADPEKVDGRTCFAWVRQGDATAAAVLDTFCQNLADGLANIACLCNPDGIVLGGGIMSRESIIRQPLEQALSERLPERMLPPKGLAFAKLRNDAGLLGALYVLKNKESTLRIDSFRQKEGQGTKHLDLLSLHIVDFIVSVRCTPVRRRRPSILHGSHCCPRRRYRPVSLLPESRYDRIPQGI